MIFRQKPTVSVLMPAHNEEKYLRQAVGSVLKQTFSDLELIIINDASTDKTAEIAQGLAQQDKRIKIINHKKNKYRSGALNSGLKKSRGKYICFLDGDDLYLPDKLEKQFNFLEKNQDIDMVYSNFEKLTENGEIKQEEAINFNKQPKQILEQAAITIGDEPIPPYKILGANDNNRIIPGCSVMIRKKVFKKIKLDEKLITAQDYDLWFQIIGRGFKLTKLPINSYRYRYHQNQISNRQELKRQSFQYIHNKLKNGQYFK